MNMNNTVKAIAAIMLMTILLFIEGCKPNDVPTPTVDEIDDMIVDGHISEELDIANLFIETLYGKTSLDGHSFTVEIDDSDELQFLAVTDADTNIYMLYRGRISKETPIVIDANSTALALVTLHPVLGPIVKPDEYSQLMDIIENNSHYVELKQNVSLAIAAHRPISDTTNVELMNVLYDFFEELNELAGLDSINGRGDVSDYLGSYPMRVVTEDNTVTMRVTVLSPSYYGTVTDSNGHSEDIRVLTRADYGFLDAFTHTYENMDWADPTDYTIRNSGNYSFEFSKNNPEGLTDYYLHLANNIAGLLGLEMDNNALDQLTASIATVLQMHQGDYGGDGMRLVGYVYQGVVDYLSGSANNGMWRNWRLAGAMLRRLTGVYNVIKGSCNGLMRIAYYLDAPNVINFCLEYYSSTGINPCSETTLTITGGNDQIGFEYQSLPLSLEVYVQSQTENGWYIHPAYTVRFEIVSGNGELSARDVVVGEDHKAQTYWTLGEGDEQEVSAVVVDAETDEELSNKVYFSASINEGVVTTLTVTDITQTSAVCGGIIADDALTFVTRCGVCWNTVGSPTVDDNHVFTGPGTGTYHCNMTDLIPNTTYYVRAFATFGYEYYYGEEKTFITSDYIIPDGDWVDLGLPSGTLWATRNVGANSPEDYGDYFAWGETQPKSLYTHNNYIYYRCDDNDEGYVKYCSHSSSGYNGYVDNLTILQPGDDAATANWGGGSRTPTYDDWGELCENCDWSWVTRNGVDGMQIIGPSGYGLFLPAAGYRWKNELCGAGGLGKYWSSSLNTVVDWSASAWAVSFSSGSYGRVWSNRYYGRTVRAVRSSRQN